MHSLSLDPGASVSSVQRREGQVRYRDPRVPLEFTPEGGGIRPW